MINPDIFVIGANKCGTNLLVDQLRMIKDINIARLKEPHFYSYYGMAHQPKGLYPIHIVNTETRYQKLFASEHRGLRLDASTDYLYHSTRVIQNFSKFGVGTNTKLVLMIRNPIARIWSHYSANRKDMAEDLDFLEAISANTIDKRMKSGWWAGYDYVGCGMYSEHITKYEDAGYTVHVIPLERYITDYVGEMSRLLKFLELNVEVPPRIISKRNRSGVPKSRLLNSIGIAIRKNKSLRSINYLLRENGLSWHRNVFKKILLQNLKQSLLPVHYEEILREIYHNEIQFLNARYSTNY